MTSADVAGLLELVAAERPDLLGPLVDALEYSRAAGGVADLVKTWGIGAEDRAGELTLIAAKTSAHLDRLERLRRVWRHPSQAIENPNVPALYSFALQRAARSPGLRKSRCLQIIGRRLERAAESERRRRLVESFLAESPAPVDREWLRSFLGPGK